MSEENKTEQPESLADLFAALGIVEKTGSNEVDQFVRDCFHSLNGGSDAQAILVLIAPDETTMQRFASTPECESGNVLVVEAPDGTDVAALDGRFRRRNNRNTSKTRAKETYGDIHVGVTLTAGEKDIGLTLNRAR